MIQSQKVANNGIAEFTAMSINNAIKLNLSSPSTMKSDHTMKLQQTLKNFQSNHRCKLLAKLIK
jgi:hypothetical protein